jgi:pimeloyl-ACP methyl ester carboxylesterase
MTENTNILIPGLLCDDIVWRPLIHQLNGNAKVADLSQQNSITEMAQDCLNMSTGPLQVVGHSMGARVAMEMARLSPERVTRLVLLDTGFRPLSVGEIERRNELIRYAYDNGMAALADRWLPTMVYEKNQNNQQLMRQLVNMVVSKTADLHQRQITALINRPDASKYLEGINCPVLLLVGREDQWSPVSQHQEMLMFLPHAHLEIIDDAGHFTLLEKPIIVADIIAKFLYVGNLTRVYSGEMNKLNL